MLFWIKSKNKKDTFGCPLVLTLKTQLVSDVGEKSYLTSTLDGCRELSLVHSACAADSSGKNLATFADELSELCGIFIVDILVFLQPLVFLHVFSYRCKEFN